jgi:hypothetical protein
VEAGRVKRWLFGGAAALVVVAVVVGVVLLRGGGPREKVQAIQATATIEPGAHLFGDRLAARVEVLVDRRAVDPASVRVQAGFTPYGTAGPATFSTRRAGNDVSLRYGFTLLCLRDECRPEPRGAKEFRFGTVQIRFRDHGRATTLAVPWPPIEVGSRLTSADIGQPQLRAQDTELPPVSYRASPGLLAGLLFVLAAGLAVGGGVLVWPSVRPLLPARRPRDELAGLPPLERAVALLRRSLARGRAADQRKALDRLARELRESGRDELAGGARELAWSEREPAPDEMTGLAGQVEATIGAER